MHTVKSKYKNPDKMIRRLEKRLNELEQLSERNWQSYIKEIGKGGMRYLNTVEYSFTVTSSSFVDDFKVNDNIIIKATVKELSGDRTQSKITFDNISVKVRE